MRESRHLVIAAYAVSLCILGGYDMDRDKKRGGIGWLFLGLTPFFAVIMWQIIVTYIGMAVFAVQQAQIDRSILTDVNRLLTEFQASTIYSVLMFVTYIGYLVFVLWYYLMFCKGKQTGSYKQILKPVRIILIVIAGILMQVGISMFLEILFEKFPSLFESYTAVMNAMDSESIFMIISICLLAPIGEEIIFRGLTFRMMRRAVPWQVAFVIQAVLFGVYHMNLVQGTYAVILGLVLGYLAYRYDSVLPGILLHIAINSSSYVVGYLYPEKLGESVLWMSIVGVVTMALSLFLIFLVGKSGTPDVSIAKETSVTENA